MKKCPYCAEEIQGEAIVCRFCGRKIPSSPTTIQRKRRVSRWIIIVIILFAIGAISRAYTSYRNADRRNNLESGVFIVTCNSEDCANGVQIYDDIRVTQRVIGIIPVGERCQVQVWYDWTQSRETLEAEYNEQFVSRAFYYVECPSGVGWIRAEHRGF